MILPEMATIKQHFGIDHIADVQQETARIVRDSGLLKRVRPGQRVAVAVGSRGIAGQVEVVGTLCRLIEETGAEPFIFPAMGSHGSATSAGQEQVLHALGFYRETVGAEILSDANGVLIGETGEGIPVYTDRYALEADSVVVVNRIKPHTKFKGPIESGIQKMLSLGMGKVEGATVLHRCAVSFGFPRVIESVARRVLEEIDFLFGMAIIEGPAKGVHSLSLLTQENLAEEEALLKTASEIMARIPFAEFDLLIVDEIGKDISGTGMDTNVTGRNRDILGDFCIEPRISRIFVRDLTEKTQGNANGIGFADFTTKRLVDKIDIKKTYTNSLAAMSPEKAAIPVYFDSDREAIEAALDSIGLDNGKDAKIVRIKNTSELAQMQISAAMLPLIRKDQKPIIEIARPPEPMTFDSQDDLT